MNKLDIAYYRTIEKMQNMNKVMTKKQYNRYAVENDLLSSTTLQYIRKSSFEALIRKIVKSA